MPNSKENAALVQDTNTATLSHETARISHLSIESKTKLIDLLKMLFGDNKADADYYIQQYWTYLTASVADSDLPAFQRQNCVLHTQEQITAIKVLHSLFIELELD